MNIVFTMSYTSTGGFITITQKLPVYNDTSGSMSPSPCILSVLTAPATANNTTSSQTDLLAGGAATGLGVTTINSHTGMTIPANIMKIGRVLRLSCYGTYTTNGATATITPNVLLTQTSISVIVAAGQASGTFASAAGPFSWGMQVIITMVDGTHAMGCGFMQLGGNNPATTVSGSPGLNSAAAGVVINPALPLCIAPTWTGSSANAGNTFQCLAATLELLA